MRILGKTLSYWWEKVGGLLSGVIAGCIILAIHPTFSNWKPFIVEFPTIGMCAFGFLLTFLGIILQGNSDTIIWMMSRDELYNRFISFNKRIVIISFVLSLYSYIIGYVNFQAIKDLLCPQLVQIAKTVMIGVFCGLLVWFIIDTLQFTRLFYVLIRKTEKK
jgi:hypothetical protein